MKTQLNTREARQTAISLINNYKYHCKQTGFCEWKENTPEYVKKLEKELEKTYHWYNTVICRGLL